MCSFSANETCSTATSPGFQGNVPGLWWKVGIPLADTGALWHYGVAACILRFGTLGSASHRVIPQWSGVGSGRATKVGGKASLCIVTKKHGDIVTQTHDDIVTPPTFLLWQMGLGTIMVSYLNGLATEAAEQLGLGDYYINPVSEHVAAKFLHERMQKSKVPHAFGISCMHCHG